MPTEQEVEAAEAAIRDHLESAFRDWSSAALARAALTAAEEVRGQVSEEDAAMLKRVENWHASADPELDDGPSMDDFVRLLALARRGAGQAVPDEAAIRADERGRLAKFVEDSAPLTSGPDYDAASDRMRHLRQEANIRARDLAAAIRAAAPKPEDKP